MVKKTVQSIEINDTEDIKNILVQVDLEHDRTQVISNFSAWENLALLMEAVGVSIEECLSEGLDPDGVYEAVDSYYKTIKTAYKKKYRL